MPLVRQRKKLRKANKNKKEQVKINEDTSENNIHTKEPEIKKFLGDKTKSIIKKQQKLIKTRKNDYKYNKIYYEFII